MGDASFPAPPPGGTPGSGAPEPPPPPPAGPSRAPLVVSALVLVVLAGAAGVAFAFARTSDTCGDASFTSERFGYCLDVTGSWLAGSSTIGDVQVDRLAQPTAPGYITIEAVALDAGTSLDDYVAAVRKGDEASGYVATNPMSRTVDGVDARSWDVTAGTSVGTPTQLREVVFVRDDVAWRVQLGDTPEAFAAHAAELDRMLDTWRFT